MIVAGQLPAADRILVQTRHTDATKARAACATVGESPEPSPSRQPCLGPRPSLRTRVVNWRVPARRRNEGEYLVNIV